MLRCAQDEMPPMLDLGVYSSASSAIVAMGQCMLVVLKNRVGVTNVKEQEALLVEEITRVFPSVCVVETASLSKAAMSLCLTTSRSSMWVLRGGPARLWETWDMTVCVSHGGARPEPPDNVLKTCVLRVCMWSVAHASLMPMPEDDVVQTWAVTPSVPSRARSVPGTGTGSGSLWRKLLALGPPVPGF